VSAGNVLNIFSDVISSNSIGEVAFSGSGTLFLEGPGEIYQPKPFTYNTCTTILVSGSFYLGSTNTSYLALPPAWGPIVLEGGTLGVVPGQHNMYGIELPDVTIEGVGVTLENIVLEFQADNTVEGDVTLTLANAIVYFSPGILGDGNMTVVAATSDAWEDGLGGIVYLPSLDAGSGSVQGPYVAVYFS